jgi:hypothetical protein
MAFLTIGASPNVGSSKSRSSGTAHERPPDRYHLLLAPRREASRTIWRSRSRKMGKSR